MKARIVIVSVVIFGLFLLILGVLGLLQSPQQASDNPSTVNTPEHSVEMTNTLEPATATSTASPTSTPSQTPTPTSTSTPTLVPTATPTMTPTATATLTPTAAPALTETVAIVPTEDPPTLVPTLPATQIPVESALPSPFAGRMWVGLYGAPSGPGLGILGRTTATNTVAWAVEVALEYQAVTELEVIPFFHMVTTVADAYPGPDGDYNHRMSPETVQLWIDVAHTYGMVSVVDIQPGYSPIQTELAYVEQFLRQKDVHLAIDPEFMMETNGGIPGQNIGHMPAYTLNIAQEWLNNLAQSVGEQKALIIHQFDNRMFSGKEQIIHYPYVDLVWDSDGFGGPGAKIGDYNQYAAEPGFEFGGFKLFYEWDVPVMTPAQVLGLNPRPVFVVYQ